MRRKRKCSECNKPLGATLVKCYECGGEHVDNHGDSLASARQWKLLLGVDPELIDEAHSESEYQEPHQQ
jgi:hypothetical protein